MDTWIHVVSRERERHKHEIMVMILNMLNDTTLPIEIIVAKWNELLAAKA